MKITTWIYVFETVVLVMAGTGVSGATGWSIRQQKYTFRNEITRDVTARTFGIDEDGKARPLTIRAREKAVTDEQGAETGKSGHSRLTHQKRSNECGSSR